MNAGLVTGSSTPRPAANPWANAVLPVPRSPARTSRSPGAARPAISAARARVSSTDFVAALITACPPRSRGRRCHGEVLLGPDQVGPHLGRQVAGAPKDGGGMEGGHKHPSPVRIGPAPQLGNAVGGPEQE